MAERTRGSRSRSWRVSSAGSIDIFNDYPFMFEMFCLFFCFFFGFFLSTRGNFLSQFLYELFLTVNGEPVNGCCPKRFSVFF